MFVKYKKNIFKLINLNRALHKILMSHFKNLKLCFK